MFFHIASIEREVYWQLGNVVCSAYPLKNLDTIHSEVFFLYLMLQRTLSSYYRQENYKQFPLWIWLCLAKSWSISTWLNMSSWIYSRSNGTALSEEHSTPSSLSSSCSSYSPPAALSCGRQLPRSLKTASRLTGMTTPPAWCPISQPT